MIKYFNEFEKFGNRLHFPLLVLDYDQLFSFSRITWKSWEIDSLFNYWLLVLNEEFLTILDSNSIILR